MARIEISQGWVEIRVSWLERLLLGERPQRLSLAQISEVDAHPRLSDLMVHWLGHHALWLSGVSPYEGQLIPSTRNPGQTLAITLQDDAHRVYVELDDESTDTVAKRIRNAIRDSVPPEGSDEPAEALAPPPPTRQVDALATTLMACAALALAASAAALLTEGQPSPLVMAAGAAAVSVTTVGYAVLGK